MLFHFRDESDFVVSIDRIDGCCKYPKSGCLLVLISGRILELEYSDTEVMMRDYKELVEVLEEER